LIITAGMAGLLQQFGENLRTARHARGWTQEDLAAKTNLAVVQVSRIERGKREVRLSTLIRLLEGLEIPPETLLKGLTVEATAARIETRDLGS
jgi:transcriptional regulator with XRE-family HTH domain